MQYSLLDCDVKLTFSTLLDRGIQVGSKGDLEDLLDFVKQPHFKLEPCIDRVFSFDKSLEAFEYMRNGGAVGKIVIEF